MLLTFPEGIDELCGRATDSIDSLAVVQDLDGFTLNLFNAGRKGSEKRFGLFARDLFLSAFMLGRVNFLKDVIIFACLTMGKDYDEQTGEEPGRVIHEFDEVRLRGLTTRYNASDTTQFFLIGLERYVQSSHDYNFLRRWAAKVNLGLDYLVRHIDRGLFWEDPSFCGADRYALRSTYWKDDKLPQREYPDFPVAYTLVQGQTIAALRAASRLVANKVGGINRSGEELEEMASEMVSSVKELLWDEQKSCFVSALDQSGLIGGVSSDTLHLLNYLSPGDISSDRLRQIARRGNELLTAVGYRTYKESQPEYSPRSYHLGSVWPFEQYFIARGAIRHGVDNLARGAVRTLDAVDRHGFYELFGWGGSTVDPLGCDEQLWTACYPLGMKRLANSQLW